MYINNLITGTMTLGSGGSTPAIDPRKTRYKYRDESEWREVMIGGEIAIVDYAGDETGQIENPWDVVEIEIGTGP